MRPTSTEEPVKELEEPVIEHLGVEIDDYNPATNRAGDFVFTKSPLFLNKIFHDYGEYITETSDGKPKNNPQPTYVLPLGTKVRAITSGTVDKVAKLYSGDYSIMLIKKPGSPWRYEMEHVINPLVKPGDKVVAGQVVAEVSPHMSESNSGYGLVEIGILKGGNLPFHFCPYAYLDPAVKSNLTAKILALYNAWEEYRGDSSLYAENDYQTPGCLTEEPYQG